LFHIELSPDELSIPGPSAATGHLHRAFAAARTLRRVSAVAVEAPSSAADTMSVTVRGRSMPGTASLFGRESGTGAATSAADSSSSFLAEVGFLFGAL